MTQLLVAGRLGNATEVWPTLDSLLASGFEGLVAIRYKEKGRLFQEGLPACEIPVRVAELVAEGLLEKLMFFNEWPRADSLVINGQICRSENYAELTYSENKNLRINQRYASGIVAVETAKSVMKEEDWEMINEIFQLYPDSVIEFTAHNRSIGRLRKNVAIWEVRNY